MCSKAKYDVFISYRRNGGQETAKIICDALKNKGYRVFFDVESLRSGNFNTKLYDVIEECEDYILVLNEDALNRCEDPNDWVRLEIECAIKNKKNIIPVMLRNFEFPETLPDSMDEIRYKNGLKANTEFFDAFIEKLHTFLKSNPPINRRITQNVVFKKTLPFFIALLVLAVAGFGVFGAVNHLNNTFPKTKAEKGITDSVYVYLEKNLVICEAMVENLNNVYTYAEQYLQNGSDAVYEKVDFYSEFALDYLSGINFDSLKADASFVDKLDNCELDGATISMLPDVIKSNADEMTRHIYFVCSLLDKDSALDIGQKQKCISILSDYLDCFSNHVKYGINEMVLPINEKYLQSFISNCNKNYLALRFADYTWIFNSEQLDSKMEANYSKQVKLTSDLSSIVGEVNYSMMVDKGNTESDIEAKRNEAMEKFAPSDEMDADTLLGYMGRNMTLGFYDQAIECLNLIQKQDPENGSVYAPILIKYVEYVKSGHKPYGVAVIGYNPSGPAHPFYKIGDIIISVDEKEVYDTDDLSSQNPDAIIKVLRCDSNGDFKEISFKKSDYSNEPFMAVDIVS